MRGFRLVAALVPTAAALAMSGGGPVRAPHLPAPKTVPNFRDLGFTQTQGERVVKPGVLYRSSTPCRISEEDARALAEIRTILDLRSEHDAQKDEGPRRLAPNTTHLPLLSEELMRGALIKRATRRPRVLISVLSLGALKKLVPSRAGSRARKLKERIGHAVDQRLATLFDTVSLSDVYWLIVSEKRDELRTAIELAASEGSLPLLMHCTHGKDRTGVLVALLLLSLGVSEEEVLADYVLSHDYACSVEGVEAMQLAFPERLRPHLRPGLLDEWCAAPEHELRDILERLKHEHGSMTAYLDSIGVDESLRKRLGERLTIPQPSS